MIKEILAVILMVATLLAVWSIIVAVDDGRVSEKRVPYLVMAVLIAESVLVCLLRLTY